MSSEKKQKSLDDSFDQQLADAWAMDEDRPDAAPSGFDAEIDELTSLEQDIPLFSDEADDSTPPSEPQKTDLQPDSPEETSTQRTAVPGEAPAGIFERLKASRLFRIASASLFLIVLAGSGAIYWYGAEQKPAKVTHFIKHRIEIPSYQAACKFLILANTQKSKELIHLVLAVEFRAVNAQELFNRNALSLRDSIYHFLGESQIIDSTEPTWQRIVEKDLFTALKARFPAYHIASVRLTHLQNL